VISEPWSVVVVPFPVAGRRQTKRRPAVALSPETFQAKLLAITEKRGLWKGHHNPRFVRSANTST
jgi:mRNA-degrading endonuclease toxin of MazEF toxin-antitoxin module